MRNLFQAVLIQPLSKQDIDLVSEIINKDFCRKWVGNLSRLSITPRKLYLYATSIKDISKLQKSGIRSLQDYRRQEFSHLAVQLRYPGAYAGSRRCDQSTNPCNTSGIIEVIALMIMDYNPRTNFLTDTSVMDFSDVFL